MKPPPLDIVEDRTPEQMAADGDWVGIKPIPLDTMEREELERLRGELATAHADMDATMLGWNALCAKCDKAEAERDAARAVLRRLEWSGSTPADFGGYWDACPICEIPDQTDYGGHAPDCALAAAIAPSTPPDTPIASGQAGEREAVPGRTEFGLRCSQRSEFHDKLWTEMSDDLRGFWARQEALAASLSSPVDDRVAIRRKARWCAQNLADRMRAYEEGEPSEEWTRNLRDEAEALLVQVLTPVVTLATRDTGSAS